MTPEMFPTNSRGLKSKSQIARVVTEEWAAANLYCVACNANGLAPTPNNTKAVDFTCNQCGGGYQLKSSRVWSEDRIPDAGYHAMMETIAQNRTPHLLVLHYTNDWFVRNLLLVPSFFFSASAIEKRKPLSPTARRAGWIGCNILLRSIAPEGKLRLIQNGSVTPIDEVRNWYERVKPITSIHVKQRGWTLDVLHAARRLGKLRFSLNEMYDVENSLAELHPNNKNVRAKIRQQLQVLRDLNLLRFRGSGEYELTTLG